MTFIVCSIFNYNKMNILIKDFDSLCKSTRDLEDQFNRYHSKCEKGKVTDIAIVSKDPL